MNDFDHSPNAAKKNYQMSKPQQASSHNKNFKSGNVLLKQSRRLEVERINAQSYSEAGLMDQVSVACYKIPCPCQCSSLSSLLAGIHLEMRVCFPRRFPFSFVSFSISEGVLLLSLVIFLEAVRKIIVVASIWKLQHIIAEKEDIVSNKENCSHKTGDLFPLYILDNYVDFRRWCL